MDHDCKHEKEFGSIEEANRNNEKALDAIRDDLKEIKNILTKNGISSRISVLAESQKRVWWWLGGISMSIMGIAFFIIKKSL